MFVPGYWNEFRIESEVLHIVDCSTNAERAQADKTINTETQPKGILQYSRLLSGTSK